MLISTRQLRAFVSVVTYGNFTKAADRLHITQAGLSGVIREFESQLECRLFNRTTRSVELTEAGERLLPYAKRALEELEQGIACIGALKDLRRGRLRVGVTPFLGANAMPSVIKAFSERRPGVRVELVDAEQHLVQQLVDSGDLDAGFGYLFTQTAGVHKQALFLDPLTLVVPRGQYSDSRWINGPEDWLALRDSTLIVLDKRNPVMPLLDEFLTTSGAPELRRMAVRHLATVMSMVGAGLGIAVVPTSTLVGEQSCRVRPVRIGGNAPSVEHCCLTKAGVGEVDGLGEFVDLFSATCQEAIAHTVDALTAD